MVAGDGPISDGIPEPRGEGGDSEKDMPPPIGTPVRLELEDVTKRIRRTR